MSNKGKPFLSEELKALFKDRKYHCAVGRRKSAVAQVRLYPNGSGKFYVNNADIKNYFPVLVWQKRSLEPLELVNQLDSMDICVKVLGGGKKGQVDSVLLGIARALIEMDEELRSALKKKGYLSRDARVKERKKFGLKRARRAPQWSKR